MLVCSHWDKWTAPLILCFSVFISSHLIFPPLLLPLILTKMVAKNFCCGLECFPEIISAISASSVELLDAQKDFLIWTLQTFGACLTVSSQERGEGLLPVTWNKLLINIKLFFETRHWIKKFTGTSWSMSFLISPLFSFMARGFYPQFVPRLCHLGTNDK